MNEQERAAYYQTHRDDPDVWGEGETRNAPRAHRGLTTTVTVRFSATDAEKLRRMAQDMDMSYSDVVREALRRYSEFSQPLVRRNVTVDYAARPIAGARVPLVTRDDDFRAEMGVSARSIARPSEDDSLDNGTLRSA